MGALDDYDPRDERIAQLEAALIAVLHADARGQGLPYEEAMKNAAAILAGKVAE